MMKIFLAGLIALSFACGGDDYLSYTNIVQTQTAENMLGNATATAVATAKATVATATALATATAALITTTTSYAHECED
mgnify:CR=1 FL=1